MAMDRPPYTCPCCGYLVFDEAPGSYEICPICFWEDDPVQIMDPWLPGGANKPNLVDAQESYARTGAMDPRFMKDVRSVQPSDTRDGTWRRVMPSDKMHVRTPASLSDDEYRNLNVWYYWSRVAI
jgi:hypothetical protein